MAQAEKTVEAGRAPWVLALALAAGCSMPMPPGDGGVDAGTSPWRVVLANQPGALLSAWESGEGVLYAVGGTASRALVLRHDDDGWWEMDPGTSRTLWWVHGFSKDDVWAVGASGVVTHFDGTRWRVEREGGPATLFGVFGTAPSALVAVGGVVSVSAPAPLVLRRTASGWGEVAALPATDARAFFKVWGRSPDDLVLVGERGLLGRGTPERLTLASLPVTDRLTTVHGNATETYVVGGLQRPVLLRLEGGQWKPLAAPGTPQLLNGVAVNGAGDVVIAGLDGYLAEGRAGDFTQAPPVTNLGLHAVTPTSTGFVAVGGDLVQTLGRGVVLARGALEGGAVRRWPHAGVPLDAGADAGVADAGLPDAGGLDGGALDGGADAGVTDAGVMDAGLADAGLADAGVTDAGVDAGLTDAGVIDAGVADAGAVDGGMDGGVLGPGDDCGMAPASCGPGMMCWFVFGPFRNYCAGTCTDAAECGGYGAGACCRLPGPQAMENVCLRADHCDAGM
ncbi:MAG: hypothetical protein JNJ54_31895 [Myxococcaceae bacterium]|nr:hypothetical protein [Myxococcaceae bacterium]